MEHPARDDPDHLPLVSCLNFSLSGLFKLLLLVLLLLCHNRIETRFWELACYANRIKESQRSVLTHLYGNHEHHAQHILQLQNPPPHPSLAQVDEFSEGSNIAVASWITVKHRNCRQDKKNKYSDIALRHARVKVVGSRSGCAIFITFFAKFLNMARQH